MKIDKKILKTIKNKLDRRTISPRKVSYIIRCLPKYNFIIYLPVKQFKSYFFTDFGFFTV